MSEPASSSRATGASASSVGGAQVPSSVVAFEVAGQRVALGVDWIREVVALERLIDVPRAPAGVLGMFPLRGAPLCALDLASLIGADGAGSRRHGLVLVRRRAVVCALAVDVVHGVFAVPPDALVPRDPQREPASVLGFCPAGDGTATVLDPAELLRRVDALRPN